MFRVTTAVVQQAMTVRDFGMREFCRTFGHLYSEKDLQDYLKEAYNPLLYEQWIADTENYCVRVGMHRETDEMLGYVLCSKSCGLPVINCYPDQPDLVERCSELKRIYVSPSAFGSGLAQELTSQAVAWFEELRRTEKDRLLFLGVYSDNHRAQHFYRKMGFEVVGEYQFRVGETFDREFIMQYKR